jgi:Ca-activated chloride channel family protein
VARGGRAAAAVPPPAPAAPPALNAGAAGRQVEVLDFAKQVQRKPGELPGNRGGFQDRFLADSEKSAKGDADAKKVLDEAKARKDVLDKTNEALRRRDHGYVQAGKSGVDLAVYSCNLRNQLRLEQTAQRQANGRNCIEIGGVWIDENYSEKTPTLVVKAQSDAYFRILDLQPQMKEVFRLGNYLVWMSPSGTALVIDTAAGKEKLSDEEINRLFVARK